MYRVIQNLTVKVQGIIKTFPVGSIVRLPVKAAQMFVLQGKIELVTEEPTDYESLNERMALVGENYEPDQIEPFVDGLGVLVIPYNSDKKYHYWNGGQSVCETLRELGRCDLIEKYKSFYSN
jgi:hypothetical protein